MGELIFKSALAWKADVRADDFMVFMVCSILEAALSQGVERERNTQKTCRKVAS